MTSRPIMSVFAVGTVLLWLAYNSAAWAAPGQSPDSQTVPIRTSVPPTASPPPGKEEKHTATPVMATVAVGMTPVPSATAVPTQPPKTSTATLKLPTSTVAATASMVRTDMASPTLSVATGTVIPPTQTVAPPPLADAPVPVPTSLPTRAVEVNPAAAETTPTSNGLLWGIGPVLIVGGAVIAFVGWRRRR